MESLIPTPDRVLVKLVNTAPQSIGKIIIPETTRERQLCALVGLVRSIGIEAAEKTGLIGGDAIVILGRDKRTVFGTPYFDGKEELFLVKYEYILAKINETDKTIYGYDSTTT